MVVALRGTRSGLSLRFRPLSVLFFVSLGPVTFAQDELRHQLVGAMEKLTDREKDIVVRYYGLGGEESTSLEAIGEDINLSRERVRQIRNDALRKMRHAVSGTSLADYLS